MTDDAIRVAHNYLKEYRTRRERAAGQERKAQHLYDVLFERCASEEEVVCAFEWLLHYPTLPTEKIIEFAIDD